MTMVPAERLADVFVEVADTLVDDFDVVEFLQTLTRRTAELSHATAAGLLLAGGDGRLQFMAASDEASRLLELFQVQEQEGPCLDSFREGEPVVNADLRTAANRWPNFAPRAVDAGFGSVHALPLRLRSRTIGALNMFGTDVGRLQPRDVHIVQAMADIATIALLQERTIRRGEILSEQLEGALNSRIVIEQAKGAVAQRQGVNVDEAFELLRGYARRHQQRLVDVAHAFVADPTGFPDLRPTDPAR